MSCRRRSRLVSQLACKFSFFLTKKKFMCRALADGRCAGKLQQPSSSGRWMAPVRGLSEGDDGEGRETETTVRARAMGGRAEGGGAEPGGQERRPTGGESEADPGRSPRRPPNRYVSSARWCRAKCPEATPRLSCRRARLRSRSAARAARCLARSSSSHHGHSRGNEAIV